MGRSALPITPYSKQQLLFQTFLVSSKLCVHLIKPNERYHFKINKCEYYYLKKPNRFIRFGVLFYNQDSIFVQKNT
ncbi:hypothetical protein Hanom_Chr12g01065971 [Helianthus anomalus]